MNSLNLTAFAIIAFYVCVVVILSIVVSGITSAEVRRWLRLRERLILAADSLLTFLCKLLSGTFHYESWLYPSFLIGSALYLSYEIARAVLSGAFAQAVN